MSSSLHLCRIAVKFTINKISYIFYKSIGKLQKYIYSMRTRKIHHKVRSIYLVHRRIKIKKCTVLLKMIEGNKKILKNRNFRKKIILFQLYFYIHNEIFKLFRLILSYLHAFKILVFLIFFYVGTNFCLVKKF